MNPNSHKNEFIIRISVLGHPDELVGQLIRQLVQSHHGQTTNHTFESISISISTLRVFIDECWVKLILVQPIGQGFFDKMVQHYFRSNGALILFSKNDAESFESARAFYHYFRFINRDPNIPVAFIEIQDTNDSLIIEESIQSEQGSPDFYYGLKSEDFKGFRKILLSLITHNLPGNKSTAKQAMV
ncbi:MAG: hypothetical protein ACFFB5_23195 [Promethearchaeota archaeon]